jgi:hypothetical protein
MNWLAENKFLAGFGAVMLVGVGALGYLTYSAMDKYDVAREEFSGKAAALKSLVEEKPALTEANLKAVVAQKQALGEKITAFREELKKRVLPVEPVMPTVFQTQLRDAVGDLIKRAEAAKVTLPKDIYLGFPAYQNAPPDANAAPALARELKAIGLVMNVLIEAGNLTLDEMKREPLPQEGGKGKPAKPAAPAPGPGKKKVTVPPPLIERSRLQLKITSADSILQKVISGLANNKQQLFIIRKITVQNKQQESPARLAGSPDVPVVTASAGPDAAAPADPAAPTGAPGDAATTPAPAPSALSYLFGMEEVTATIDLEIPNIADSK